MQRSVHASTQPSYKQKGGGNHKKPGLLVPITAKVPVASGLARGKRKEKVPTSCSSVRPSSLGGAVQFTVYILAQVVQGVCPLGLEPPLCRRIPNSTMSHRCGETGGLSKTMMAPICIRTSTSETMS